MAESVYRIRTKRPVVWRTPDSLQVGVDKPLTVVNAIPDQAAPLIHALQDGISTDGFDALRRRHHISEHDARSIVTTLAPAFHSDPEPRTFSLSVVGRTRATRSIAEHLAHFGASVRVESHIESALEPPVDHLVLAADFLLDPSWRIQLGTANTSHIPVVFTDRGVRVGPQVTPGVSPCLSCGELWNREDPHWLSVGSQLWATPALHATKVAATVAATLVAALSGVMTLPVGWSGSCQHPVLHWEAPTGQVTVYDTQFHPDCFCRGL